MDVYPSDSSVVVAEVVVAHWATAKDSSFAVDECRCWYWLSSYYCHPGSSGWDSLSKAFVLYLFRVNNRVVCDQAISK